MACIAALLCGTAAQLQGAALVKMLRARDSEWFVRKGTPGQHPVLFCGVRKVAIQVLEYKRAPPPPSSPSPPPPPRLPPRPPLPSPATHTHVRAAVGFRRVHSDAELASLLSDKNVLRSMLVRDPFHRFLSFYRNKIQMVEIKNNKAPPDPCSARRPCPPLMRVTLATCHRSSR